MNICDVCKRVALAACFVVVQSTVYGAELQKLTASNGGDNDEFGHAIAVRGGVAVVGAYRDDSQTTGAGSAYVFHYDPVLQSWHEVRQLLASDAGPGDSFGSSAAVDGDLAVVGAFTANPSAAESGAAYIFGRNVGGPDNWGEVVQLVPSTGGAFRLFGISAAVSGDTVVVGMTGNPTLNEEGAAFIFQRDQGGLNNWGEVKRIEADGVAPLNQFGLSVALDGDSLAVGAPGDSDDALGAGAVYVYSRNKGGADQWGVVRKLAASDVHLGDRFGTSVSLRGDLLLAGATERDAAISSPGAAYIYARDEGGADQWGFVQRLFAPGGASGALFGAAVSISGTAAVAGAPEESSAGTEAGAGYLFTRDAGGGGWSFSGRLMGTDSSGFFRLGTSVSVDQDVILLGASKDNSLGRDAGSVYVFGVPAAPVLSIQAIGGGEVEVSWLPNRSGFELETAPGLFPPAWVAAPSGSENPVTIPAAAGSAFYRVATRELLEIGFLPVGSAGNVEDPATGRGGVLESYQIAEFEVTNDEYAAFLNAVAATDAFNLYNVQMALAGRGGIVRSGVSGSHSYAAKASMGNKPVNFVSFFDALRFANWLHNGQPSGGQNASTTEDGAYTFTGAASAGPRNAGAKVWLPSEDEWYKAAYFDPAKVGGEGYWLNPTRSDAIPDAATADATGNIDNDSANIANYGASVTWNGEAGNVTTVGSGGPGSRSFAGAADMGGNVAEWNESTSGALRGIRGGSWEDFESSLESTSAAFDSPGSETDTVGFRVARP